MIDYDVFHNKTRFIPMISLIFFNKKKWNNNISTGDCSIIKNYFVFVIKHVLNIFKHIKLLFLNCF